MTRHTRIVCSCMMLAAWTAHATFIASDYRFIKTLDQDGLTREDIAAADLDDDVYAETRDNLADLRLRSDDGMETPFLLEKATRSSPVYVDERVPTVRDGLELLDDNRMRVTLHRKDTDTPPAYLVIETPLRNYEKVVRVEGRRPGQSWQRMADEQRIFDYSRFMDVRSNRVELPAADFTEYRVEFNSVTDVTTSGVVRLTREMRGGKVAKETDSKVLSKRDFRVNRIVLWRRAQRESVRREVEQHYAVESFSVSLDEKEKRSEVQIATRRQPLCEFEIQTRDRNFSRQVKLQIQRTTPTGPAWVDHGSGRITNLDLGSFRRSSLTVHFPEVRAELFRLLIVNQDSPALNITGIRAKGKVHQVLFLANPDRRYELFFGNEEAKQAVYDTGNVLRTLLAQRDHVTLSVKLEAMTPNAEFGRRPTFVRLLNSKAAFTVVVAVMALALGWGVYKAAKRIDLNADPSAQDTTADE